MIWGIEFLQEAEKDMKRLDHSVQIQVLKGIKKVSKNPLPVSLTNLMKIKFRDIGIRVVYKIEYVDEVMKIIVISARTDEQVYKEASKRRKEHNI